MESPASASSWQSSRYRPKSVAVIVLDQAALANFLAPPLTAADRYNQHHDNAATSVVVAAANWQLRVVQHHRWQQKSQPVTDAIVRAIHWHHALVQAADNSAAEYPVIALRNQLQRPLDHQPQQTEQSHAKPHHGLVVDQ